MTNSKNERIALFAQRAPHSLAIDLVVLQDQLDALAAQLHDATKQIGAQASMLRDSKKIMTSAYLYTPEGCPVDDRMMDVAARIDAALAGEPATARRVRKTGGSFQHTGTVVSEFRTVAGEPRIVLEFDAPVAGMLHIYRPDQVEPLGPQGGEA